MTKARPIDWGFENSGHWEIEGGRRRLLVAEEEFEPLGGKAFLFKKI